MNIFVTHPHPTQSAMNLPDKHVVKMPLETVQMLSVIYSPWYYDTGVLHRANGEPYKTERGAFRNHPCTIWAAANKYNLAWLIYHGFALCDEYEYRFDKVHACYKPMIEAELIYESMYKDATIYEAWVGHTEFTRAMPEHIKFDTSISSITAYKIYLNTKGWVSSNYLRKPSRKPPFILS